MSASSKVPVEEVDKHNLFSPFMKKFDFEEKNYDVDDSVFYGPIEPRIPNTHDVVKRFLKQVRESRGYDVDCWPPGKLSSPFMPVPLEHFQMNVILKKCFDNVIKAAEFALDQINATTGSRYKLVEIEKFVNTHCSVKFLTFTAKEGDDAPVQTLQAKVHMPPRGEEHTLEEWRFKSFTTTSPSADG